MLKLVYKHGELSSAICISPLPEHTMCAFKEARMALRLEIFLRSCTLFIALIPFSAAPRIARALRQICRLCSRATARVLAWVHSRSRTHKPHEHLYIYTKRLRGEYLLAAGSVGERFNFWRNQIVYNILRGERMRYATWGFQRFTPYLY